jgi:hypothetical protein
LCIGGRSSISQIADAGTQFCRLNWTELQADYMDNPNWPYIDTYCFLNSYSCALLHYGFGFDIKAHSVCSGWCGLVTIGEEAY